MNTITGEQLQKASGLVRSQARKAPLEVTYHGRPELIIMSVDDYNLLRANRKIVMHRDEMPLSKLKRIAGNRMATEHAERDALMDK
ncbi:MAG: hypothetical protein EXR11_07600 [Rhodospirillaceae bacterium]|nr:hypothetical protein [Rhodospirillaceae bacterium]